MGKHFIINTLCLALLGCSITDPEPQSGPIEVSQVGFELKEGALENHAEPLPDQKPIYTIWHYSDGATKQVLSYRGWDFNKDGRLDMLEVLSLDGTPEAMAFDFDGDGKIDMLKKRRKNEFDISQAVNMPSAPNTSNIAH